MPKKMWSREEYCVKIAMISHLHSILKEWVSCAGSKICYNSGFHHTDHCGLPVFAEVLCKRGHDRFGEGVEGRFLCILVHLWMAVQSYQEAIHL